MKETPVGAAVRGAAAGLAATALLSALSRILPGLRARRGGSTSCKPRGPAPPLRAPCGRSSLPPPSRAREAAREPPFPEDRQDPGAARNERGGRPRQEDSPASAAVGDGA